jgi:glycosyltransferase involved in cell wall biosynthesis
MFPRNDEGVVDSQGNKAPCLRVLVVGHTYTVGINQQKLHALANTSQVEIGLLVPARWRDRDWRTDKRLERPYTSFILFPARVWFGGRGGAYLFPPWTVLKAIRQFKPDLIQVEQEVFSLSAFQMALTSRWHRLPLVVFCWENMEKKFSAIRRWTRKIVLDTASLILAGSTGAEKLLRRWGYAGNVEIIPQLGVDRGTFQPGKKSPSAFFTIGYVGRLVPEKGIETIFSAAARLISKGYALRILLCGSGPDEVRLRALAETLELSGNVIWRAGVPHTGVPAIMVDMDTLVLPSRTMPDQWKEQFGHVLIEAMAMGIPVIGSNCGAIPEVIGREDLIFPENDPIESANLIQKLIDDPAWRKAISAYGLARVNDLFTHEAIAARLVKLWKRTLPASSKENRLIVP